MSRSMAFVPYPLNRTQSITTGGTSARTSSGVGEQTRFVGIFATAAAYYALGGSTVTASATAGTPIGAGENHFIQIRPGQYVAAIQRDGAGVVEVAEFAS